MTAILFVIAIVAIMSAAPIQAQIVRDSVPELKGIDVIEHLSDTIPLDLTFVDDHGDSVMLGQYFEDGKPVLLTLAYSNCPMLCTVVLNGLSNGVRQLAWRPGNEFRMVTVSIDPRETVDETRAKKIRYTEAIGKPGIADGWAFLVGAESQSRALADALGFKYYYDEEIKQYAHPAVTFVVTEDGVISRYLYGIEYKERDLRLSLVEASEGKIGSTIDRIILYCFHYDPDARGYVAVAGNIMRLGGFLTMIVLGLFLAMWWLRERARRHGRAPQPVAG